MKKILLLYCCLASLHFVTLAQAPLKLDIGPIDKAGTKGILPSYGNLLTMMKATNAQFKAAMKLYGYVESQDNSEEKPEYHPASDSIEHWSLKKTTKSIQIINLLGLLDNDVEKMAKSQPPNGSPVSDGTPISEGGMMVYPIVIKDARGAHHYNVIIGNTAVRIELTD